MDLGRTSFGRLKDWAFMDLGRNIWDFMDLGRNSFTKLKDWVVIDLGKTGFTRIKGLGLYDL